MSEKETLSENVISTMKNMDTENKVDKLKKSIVLEKKEAFAKQIQWYKEHQNIYEDLAEKMATLIGEILDAQKIDYAYIEWRPKEIESYEKKLRRGIVKNGKEMQDLAGIRIVCYISSDVEKISRMIEENFQINQKLSRDKSEILGDDKVGYQSVHFIATLDNERARLPENKKFEGLSFEIQVRTILQHAWAQIEHEKKYKFSGQLPKGIPRRFNLIAGLLELADNEFDQLSKMIEEYSKEVKAKTKTGKLDIPINATSLLQFLLEKYKNFENIVPNFRTIENMTSSLRTLDTFDIKSLSQLDKILLSELIEKYKQKNYTPDFTDLVVGSLVIKNGKKFFEKITKDNQWVFEAAEIATFAEYGIKIDEVSGKS